MSNPKLPLNYSFTLKPGNRLREIVTDIGISEPFVPTPGKKNDKVIHNSKALWDTGATNSVVTVSMATALGLKPISKVWSFHAKGKSLVNVYLVNIYLPNNIMIPNVRVSECEDGSGNFGVIIGMDIITIGDFAITNVGGITTFSYRIPSVEEINFEKEPEKLPKPPIDEEKMKFANTSRNALCPCGSGKKYKHCHGKN